MKYNIVAGTSQILYHNVASDESTMLTTPKQQAILEYLAQITFDEFPEFIRDILIKIEGHTPVDITDGPGDEKQDILTITPDGKRCLTQCKHTINYESKYNGDELDIMVAAALRKDCRKAFFVTNGDLTPQGKKYVTDKEYERGWPSGSDPIVVDYLNNIRLWDKIQGNADIMHKWFAGLGQTNGLRHFKFDVTVQKLPYKSTASVEQDTIVNKLVEKKLLTEIVEGLHYQTTIDEDIMINVKKWFQFSGDLDIYYLPPHDDDDFIYKPMYALSVEVIITNKEKYSPKLIRQRVIKYLFDNSLSGLQESEWWHITAGRSSGFIYLHDIGEPRKLILDSAETFVKIETNDLVSELDYCTLGNQFSDISKDDDDDDIFIHKDTGCQVIQLFDQKIDPVEDYNYQVIQQHQIADLKRYSFRAVDSIDAKLMMRIRRMLPMDWVALQMDQNALIWCFPPETDESMISKTEKKIELLGIKILQVKSDDIPEIINNISTGIGPAGFHMLSDMNRISFPINLSERIFWISKYLDLDKKITEDRAANLLIFKYSYEDDHGHNNMMGETTLHTHTSELHALLFDMMSFRGKRMIDIGILTNQIWINVRFRERRNDSSDDLALQCIEEFERVYSRIVELI